MDGKQRNKETLMKRIVYVGRSLTPEAPLMIDVDEKKPMTWPLIEQKLMQGQSIGIFPLSPEDKKEILERLKFDANGR